MQRKHGAVAYQTFLIDTLAFDKKQIGDTLGKFLLENSKICKVMHGCVNSDVWWLARDYGCRVVSVLDTQEFEKCVVQGKNSVALSALWLKYCDKLFNLKILADKEKFQKSDWTERPLPVRMQNYAAHDSYFLTLIAQKQIGALCRGDTTKDNQAPQLLLSDFTFTDNENFVVWFNNFQIKLHKTLQE